MNSHYPEHYWDPYTQTWYVNSEPLPPGASGSSSGSWSQNIPTYTHPQQTSQYYTKHVNPVESTTEPDFDYEPQLSQLLPPSTTEPVPEVRPYIRKRKSTKNPTLIEPFISEKILSGEPFPLYGRGQGDVEENVSVKRPKAEVKVELEKVKSKLSNLQTTHMAEARNPSLGSSMKNPSKTKEPKLLFHRVGAGIPLERAQKSIEEHKKHLKGTAAYLTRKADEARNLEVRRKN
ncbi:hypothetical protein K7432_009096 [Basidiobolus ranarum]|uniref:Uncharacterized protein n=1 Tax=Basidiobolus ranarum TaxID=34480 RepID=A0ABR2WQT6_9FUNG